MKSQITHCYYPKDLLNEYLYDTPCLIIGLQQNSKAPDYVIVTLIPFNPRRFSVLFELQILRLQMNRKIVFSWNRYESNTMEAEVNLPEAMHRRKRKKGKKHRDKDDKIDKIIHNSLIDEDDDDMKFFVLGFLNYQSEISTKYHLPLNFIYNSLTKFPISPNIQLDLTVILFDVPDPRVMQFYSIEPIEILDDSSMFDDTETKEVPAFLNKMKNHGDVGNVNDQERNFSQIIQTLNECYFYRLYFYNEIVKLDIDTSEAGLRIIKPWEQSFSLTRNLQNFRIFLVNHLYFLPSYGGYRNHNSNRAKGRKRSKSKSMRNITPSKFPEIITGYEDETSVFSKLEKVFKRSVIYFVVFVRMMIEVLFSILNIKCFRNKRLVEISLTAQQIDLRLQQLCSIPSQFVKIKQRHNSSDFIRLYNTIWLILNDVIFGFTLGQYVYERSDVIVEFMKEKLIREVLFNNFYTLTLWLMNFPAGFKLNSNLAEFFGELFLWIIDFFYSKVLMSLFFTNYVIPGCIFAISYGGGVFGATFTLSLICDFLNFITLHIFCFYFASAKIFKWLLVILKSLFNLFYGKKNNVLKKRIDSADYTLDQLLLGTLLFTITLFIILTVLAFYLTFAAARLTILLIMISLEMILACLNHFPIFAVLLRVKDQFRVPGGINFILLNFISEEKVNKKTSTKWKNNYYGECSSNTSDDDSQDSESDDEFLQNTVSDVGNIIYLELKNEPLPYQKIFLPYILLSSKFKEYYLSTSTLTNLINGNPISVSRNKLYHLLYSMLPNRPIETNVLYKDLIEHYIG